MYCHGIGIAVPVFSFSLEKPYFETENKDQVHSVFKRRSYMYLIESLLVHSYYPPPLPSHFRTLSSNRVPCRLRSCPLRQCMHMYEHTPYVKGMQKVLNAMQYALSDCFTIPLPEFAKCLSIVTAQCVQQNKKANTLHFCHIRVNFAAPPPTKYIAVRLSRV